MRTFLKVLAWVGFGFMAIGVALSFTIWMAQISYVPDANPGFGPGAYWRYVEVLDILGLLLMYIGGLTTRPKYYWLLCVSLGLLHILFSMPSEWNYLVRAIHEYGMKSLSFWIFYTWPGLAAILLGILLLIIDNATKEKHRSSVR
jgi:hypothetical protein